MFFLISCIQNVQVTSMKQEGKKRILELKQGKFNADGTADEGGSKWLVPILVGSTAHPNPDKPHTKALMEQPTMTLTVDDIDEKDWITVLLFTSSLHLYLHMYFETVCSVFFFSLHLAAQRGRCRLLSGSLLARNV